MEQTEIFVPKSLAMELRKKGFNEPCVGWYYVNQGGDSFSPNIGCERNDWLMDSNSCTAPTYDQVVGWFADKHGISIETEADMLFVQFTCTISRKNVGYLMNVPYSPNRQQSLLTAFEEALKLI